MSNTLPNSEIKKRISRLNNLEKMYAWQKKTIKKLKDENKVLKAENEVLKRENKDLRERIEKLELIVEELQKMIFKGKNKWKKGNQCEAKELNLRKERTKTSYRRPIPEGKEVTDTEVFSITWCFDCGWELINLQEIVRYKEDMNIPIEEQYVLKKVTKEIIQKGYCEACKKWTYGKTIPSQESGLWSGIKSFIVYGTTFLRMSYSQLISFLKTMVNIKISEWAIVKILQESARSLRWEYESMKERIRSWTWVHYDETGRDVQSWKERRYARTMVWSDGIERIYSLWDSRWGWNAIALKWESEAVGISDNYWAYKNLFKNHQLCWAHPIRKMRDLTNSKKLNNLQLSQCKVSYDWLRSVHKTLLWMLEKEKRTEKEKIALLTQFDESIQIKKNEPDKMKKIKESLKRDKQKYFTCLEFDWIPTTNNTAERVLRPLVIKRKLSFWSKTSDWARMMEVIYSIVFSLLAKSTTNFFDRYLALIK